MMQQERKKKKAKAEVKRIIDDLPAVAAAAVGN